MCPCNLKKTGQEKIIKKIIVNNCTNQKLSLLLKKLFVFESKNNK